MEKTLLEEISRINSLIKKDFKYGIISEGNILAKLASNALEFIEKNIKKIPNTVDEFTVGSVKIRKFMFDKLTYFLQGRVQFNQLSKLESFTLGKILSQDDSLIDELYTEIIRDFLKKNPDATEKELLEMIDYQVRVSGNIRKTLNDIFSNPNNPNESELYAGLIGDKILKKIRTIPKEEIGATKQFLQGMGMSALEYLKKVPVLNKYLKEVYFNQLEKLDNLEKKFIGVTDEMKSKLSEGGDFDVTNEIKELNSILSQFAIQINKQQALVWQRWKDMVGEEFQKIMPKLEDKKFQEFYKYFENTTNTKNPPTLTYTKMDAAKKMFSWGQNGFWGNLNQFRKRLGNSLLLLDPRTVDEVMLNLEKYGTARGLGKEFGDKLLATLVFWPSIFGAVQTTLDYIEYGIQKKFDVDIPAGDAEFVKNNEAIFNQIIIDNILNALGNFGSHWLNNVGIGGKDLTSLFGWSPTLWAIGQKFWGDKKNKNTSPEKIKSDLDKANQDVNNAKDTAVKAVIKEPELLDSIRKLNPNVDKELKKPIIEPEL